MSPRKRSQKPPASDTAEAPAAAPEREVSSVDAIAGVQEAVVEEPAEATDAEAEASANEAAANESAAQQATSEEPSEPALGDDAALDDAVTIPPPAANDGEPTPRTREHLKRVIESLVFVSDQVITAQQIARIVKTKSAEVRELIGEIMTEYEGRGIELVEVASGFQFRSAAASAPFVRDLVSARPVRLTRAQLETLALVAYRQPITRPEIDDVRGVDSGATLKVLLERNLLKILGRKDEPGRPLLYGTTPYFLEFFGMKGMQDLPTLREFTDLSEESRELFKRKTNEIPDLSTEAAPAIAASGEAEEESFDDDELFAIAEAAKAEAQDGEAAKSEPAESAEPEVTASASAAESPSSAAPEDGESEA